MPAALDDSDLADLRCGLDWPDATDAEISLLLERIEAAGFLICRRRDVDAEAARVSRMVARTLVGELVQTVELLEALPDHDVLTPAGRDELLARAALPPVPERIPVAFAR